MCYSFSLDASFKWDSVNAKKRGVLSLQSWVRIWISTMRPVADKRPPILANTNEGLVSGEGGDGSLGGWGTSPSPSSRVVGGGRRSFDAGGGDGVLVVGGGGGVLVEDGTQRGWDGGVW